MAGRRQEKEQLVEERGLRFVSEWVAIGAQQAGSLIEQALQ